LEKGDHGNDYSRRPSSSQSRKRPRTVKYNVPAEGQPPIIGTLYVQKWFAGNAKELEVVVRKG
jgi:hypothetical protein